MEVTGYNSGTVHVLRQGFMPNEPFRKAISDLVLPGHDEPRLFSVWGADERMIPAAQVTGTQYAQQKHAADALYEKHRHIVVQPSAEFGARMLQAGKNGEQRRAAVALQLVMKPANFREFSLLRSSLDAVPVADRRTPLGLHATQLYIDLPFAALRPLDEVKQGIAAIREQLPAALGARSLLQLVPDPRLHGEFRNYVPTQSTDATYPEERAS
jgi:hypothetical protein